MNLNKPKPFTPDKNHVARDWQIWKNEFLVYLKLSNGYTQFSEEQRALLLINFMGTEAIKAMDEMPFENLNDKKDMDILLIKFDEYFNPSLNEVEERFKFFSRRKHPDEDLDKYISELNEKAAKCNFGDQSEKFIMDMLVLSMDKHLRELIWASKLETLPDVMYNYKLYNINQDKMEEMSETIYKNLSPENSENARSYSTEQPRKYYPTKRVCSKCGTTHSYKECPAFDVICQMCFLKGHYTSKCKRLESLNKGMSVSDDQNEKSKPSTSQVKQSQKQGSEGNTLQNCLWCHTRHTPGNCPHDAKCAKCDKFPHFICFECKKNPHEHTCYYKSILTLPVIQMKYSPNEIKTCSKCGNNHGIYTPCKYCGSCQTYGHWVNECPTNRNNNQSNTRAQPTVHDLIDGFVEIGNAFRTQGQPQRQAPVHNRPKQVNQNQHKPSTDNRNKNEKSDTCCIS